MKWLIISALICHILGGTMLLEEEPPIIMGLLKIIEYVCLIAITIILITKGGI